MSDEVKRITGSSIIRLFRKGVKPALKAFATTRSGRGFEGWNWSLVLLNLDEALWLHLSLGWSMPHNEGIKRFNRLEGTEESTIDVSTLEFRERGSISGHALSNLAKTIAGMIDIHRNLLDAGHREASEWNWRLYKDSRTPDESTLLVDLEISSDSNWVGSFKEAGRLYSRR